MVTLRGTMRTLVLPTQHPRHKARSSIGGDMKALALVVALFGISIAYAQAPTPAPTVAPRQQVSAPVKSRALLAAEAKIKEQEASIAALTSERDKLQGEKAT